MNSPLYVFCFFFSGIQNTPFPKQYTILSNKWGAVHTYNAYVNGTLEDVKGFCAVVDTEKIAEQDYILTPGRYVGVEEQEDDGEPFEEKMARLTSELSDLFKQSHKLEAEIKEKLGAIGYEI